MHWREAGVNLRFERRSQALAPRLIPIGLALAVFNLLWVLVPHNAVYWLMLLLVSLLAWIASYGWRQALATLIALLIRWGRF